MTDKQTEPTYIELEFSWTIVRPDNRQYRQQSLELSPAQHLEVVVKVPLQGTYIHNAADILQAQLSSGNVKVPEPKLTPEGLRYVHDLLTISDSSSSETSKEENGDEWASEEDWGDSKETSKTEEKEEDLSWDDDDEDTEKPDEAEDTNWDEKEEDWG